MCCTGATSSTQRRASSGQAVPEQGLDVFGDGSVEILFLPGHSPGSVALKVRLPSRTIILSGDVAHARAAMPFPLDSDSERAVRSLRALKRMEGRDDTEVSIGHDPDDWRRYGPGQYVRPTRLLLSGTR